MATERQLPADVAAAFDRVPAARDRFAALPAERQAQWLAWIDAARGRRGRARRIDELLARLAPSRGATATEEVAEPAPPPPEREWWPWLLLLLLLVVGGLLAWYFLTRDDDQTTVPNVIGLREQVAENRLHDANLKALTARGASERPQGVVFKQRPGPQRKVDEGTEVTITISSGPARVAVPDVRNLQEQAATQQLKAAGFRPRVQRSASSKQKGTVLDQEPLPGVTALKGSEIMLTVSSGVKPVVVPSVVGLPQNDAVAKLTDLGLVPQIRTGASTRPKGVVFGQDPPAGKEVDKGSKVLITVSSGSGSGSGGGTTTTTTSGTTTAAAATAPVPTVTGLAAAAGLRRLNTAGFRPTLRYAASSQPAGRILSQSPSGGTSSRTGSRVRLSASTGANPGPATTVPDVTGQDQAAAGSAIRDAGLRPLVLFRQTTDQTQQGTVIEQQPAAGSNIPRGSVVALIVGTAG